MKKSVNPYLMAASETQLGRSDQKILYIFECLDPHAVPASIEKGSSEVTVHSGADSEHKLNFYEVCPSLATGHVEVVHCVVRCDLMRLVAWGRGQFKKELGDFERSEWDNWFSEDHRQDQILEEAVDHLINKGVLSYPFALVSQTEFKRKLRARVFSIAGEFGLAEVKTMPVVATGIAL